MENSINQNQTYLAEDEIDLKELFNTIWQYKLKIFIFCTIAVILSILYAMSKPNIYESKTLLMPQENSKPAVSGGLAALAGMAGVDVGGSGAPNAEQSYSALINNYDFMKKYILAHAIHKKLNSKESQENYKFAFGVDSIYKLLNSSEESSSEEQNIEDKIFETYKTLKELLSVSSAKDSAIITLSAQSSDPYLAKYLVETFLSYASSYLKTKEMQSNQRQVEYYNQAMQQTSDVVLKTKLAELASALIQKKVLADANKFYNVQQFTTPEVAYVKDKVGPKRALIVVVSAVTSFILAVFLVFFIEFIKNEKD